MVKNTIIKTSNSIGISKDNKQSKHLNTFPKLSMLTKDTVSFTSSKVKECIDGNEVVGKTIFIDTKTKNSIPVVITKEQTDNSETFRIIDVSTNDPDPMGIGWIKVSVLNNSDTKVYNNNPVLFINKMAKIDEDKSGIGTLLHQIAIERSVQLGLDGRVELSPDYNSHPFHFLSGYRASITDNESISANKFDSMLEELIVTAKQNNNKVDLSSLLQEANCKFYLPKYSFDKWKTKIVSNKILC